jgi:Flp pilus assembly protein TadD
LALYEKGRLEEAEAEDREAVRLKEDYAQAYTNLARDLGAQGRLEEAEVECRKAIRLRRDLPEAHSNLGNVFYLKGQLDEAIAEYREAVRLNKEFPGAHNNLGNALLDKGQVDEAIAECREAIRLNKNYAEAHCNLGNALKDKGQLDEATAQYQEAIVLKKDYPEAHYNLGNALTANGRLDEAIAEFREALRLKKDDPDAHNNLALVLQWKAAAERLPSILKGEAQPAGAAECVVLAGLCQQPFKGLCVASARFYTKAFAARPDLAEKLGAPGGRYDAACAAALAGCGQGQDAGRLSDKERAGLRKQARDWLNADLEAWRRLLETGPEKNHPAIAQQLAHWLEDTDFAGVRGEPALAKLPEVERAEWQKLWQGVEALRQRAARPPHKAAPRP